MVARGREAGAVVAFELPCLNIHVAIDGVKAIGSCPDHASGRVTCTCSEVYRRSHE